MRYQPIIRNLQEQPMFLQQRHIRRKERKRRGKMRKIGKKETIKPPLTGSIEIF